MIRLNFYLTEKQIDGLQQHAAETGITLSETVRRAVDDFLKRRK
jgi:hypothetical protein